MKKEKRDFSVGELCKVKIIIAGIVAFFGLMVCIGISGVMTDRRYEERSCGCEICLKNNITDEYKVV